MEMSDPWVPQSNTWALVEDTKSPLIPHPHFVLQAYELHVPPGHYVAHMAHLSAELGAVRCQLFDSKTKGSLLLLLQPCIYVHQLLKDASLLGLGLGLKLLSRGSKPS